MAKITVVGAGNVGATCANVLAFNEVADEIVFRHPRPSYPVHQGIGQLGT